VIPSILTRCSPVCRTIQINGKQHYLWRAVDQEGEVVEVYLQARRSDSPLLMLQFTICSIRVVTC
jgi:hypothetical protein